MGKIRNLTAFASLIFILLIHAFAQGATSFTKVVMTTGSISEREGAIYVAQDLGFFRKYGLDVSFIQVRSGPIGMAALSSGESHLHWGSVSAANLGAIAEGADLVFIAGFVNRLTGMFVANPKITRPEELKGKRIGVNSLSGGGWIFTVLTLDYWGILPERDKIQFRSLGDQSVIAQGVLSGACSRMERDGIRDSWIPFHFIQATDSFWRSTKVRSFQCFEPNSEFRYTRINSAETRAPFAALIADAYIPTCRR